MSEELVPISSEDYARIEQAIASDASPVGIDAKHTHVLIIKLLLDLHRRLEAIEERVSK